MNFAEQEQANGVRFSWNVFPPTKAAAVQAVVPLGSLYTPLRELQAHQVVEFEPIVCRNAKCGAVLNPYVGSDFRNKTWFCPICRGRNPFPPHYSEHISEQCLPVEMQGAFTTVEYQLPNAPVMPPAYVLVVDTAMIEEEMSELKDALQQALSVLPGNAVIGLVTFGTMCYVHELGGTGEFVKSYAFRGDKEIAVAQVAAQLGFATRNDPRGALNSPAARRFLCPAADCDVMANQILDELERDAWPVGADRRAARCTGTALSVAVGLMETLYAQNPGRVLLFMSGPPSLGPGAVCSTALKDTIRSHLDLQQETANAQHTKRAIKFYTAIAQRAVDAGLSVDMLMCSLDQVGLYEMRVVSDKSGGINVMSDSFSMHVFKDSLRRMVEVAESGFVGTGFAAKLDVFTSPDLKVSGMFGPGTATGVKAQNVSEVEVCEGGSRQFQLGACEATTTCAVYYDIVAERPSKDKQAFIQFQTSYAHPCGKKRLRVTTVSYRYAEPDRFVDLALGFDQEAAVVLLSRLAVWRTMRDDPSDVLRWLDRTLIRLVAKFAEYRPNDPTSFRLSAEFQMFPQFVYHLRRSTFLQTFNASPDETAFARSLAIRENVANTLVMIQPALMEYSLDRAAGAPVRLDAQSMRDNVVLLLDSFTHVVVWRGQQIQAWTDAGYHEREEYANLHNAIFKPVEDSREIMQRRFPVPKFVQTSSGGSQARFLTSKVNPSMTHNADQSYGRDDPNVIKTDDVPLKVFMDHLIKLAVQT